MCIAKKNIRIFLTLALFILSASVVIIYAQTKYEASVPLSSVNSSEWSQAAVRTNDVPAPLPGDCDGVAPGNPDACCIFGYVYDGDATVVGVNVHIESLYGSIDTVTADGGASSEPYYSASLSAAPLYTSPGDVIAITVSYGDMVSARNWTVQGGGQQVDLGLVTGYQAAEVASAPTSNADNAKPALPPLAFIENVGQFDDRARFQVRSGNTTLILSDDTLWVNLTESSHPADSLAETETPNTFDPETQCNRGVNLKLSFVGANPHARLEPFHKLDTQISFFTGSDPDQWRTHVPAWSGVRYVDLYPGLDLEITSNNGQLAQRLVVREYSSLHNVSLRVEGADNLALDGNYLRLATPLGDFALPLLTVAGAAPEVEPVISAADGTYQVLAPFASMSPTAIEATLTNTATLLYSTYLGGSGEDRPYDIALDSAGNVHIVGETSSTDFPTTAGAYDTSYGGDPIDVFVAKLSADGSTLVYSTYLGGDDEDAGNGITVDSADNVYITGKTYSTDFPTTPGALDTTLSGGRDAFVAKLNAAGDDLIYSTYLGGTSWDYGFCIAIDDGDNAYVAGFTHGSFPVTSGAAQTTFGGSGDGFAVKLSPDGRTLLYSTYLGGYSWEGIDGIAIDNAGNAYLASYTHSTDFPTTPGAWDRVCDNCQTNFSTDGAVAKLNADGSEFIYSTLIGGADAPGVDAFTDISIDSAGNAYLTGHTSSTDFPTTVGALQPDFGGGGDDAVVVKLNADGSDLLYSTYLGGGDADRGYSIAIDGDGNAYLTGYTASTDFATVDPLQASNAGGYDAFVAKVNDDGSTLLYSTYLGGSGDEICFNPPIGHAEIALDRTRNIYLAGSTGSTDFPTTAGAFDSSSNGGNQDLFVTKLKANSTFVEINTGDIVNDGGSSSGACWGDYDNDGWLDLFVANWRGENNFLYHNNGYGTFAKIISGAIVNDGGWSRSCTWGDYDNDGQLDLFVSNDGGGNFLYHNEGDGTFARITSGPIASDGGNCYGTMWVDYDNDGWLDLFVARHTNADNLLYHNNGDGSFAKITDGDIVNDGGYSQSASWGDYDSDGCLDLFVGNVNYQNNLLYHNNCDGTFSKITSGAIVTDGGFSSSSNWVDYDNDGDLDLFVGNWDAENFLYRNNGSGTFTSIKTGIIVTDGDVHHSSWGDFDNDGDADLFAGPEDRRDDNPLYQNNGDGTFTKAITGTIVSASGRSGPNWADYDNDGDLDLFIAVSTGDNSLFQNSGNDNHWINIEGIGTVSNKAAVGARVRATATIRGVPVQQMQEISAQTGMYSQNSLNVEFGLGDATVISSVVVEWPLGIVQVLENVAVDQFLVVTEPASPTAAFNGSPLSGTAPLDVHFNDQSTGAIISWDWVFGDGGTSGARHPSYTYENTGVYSVSLTVSGPLGSDTEVKTDYINAGSLPPVASIDFIQPNPAPYTSAIIFNASCHDADERGAHITNYYWTSSVDGLLSSQEDFTIPASALSIGVHTIRFQCRDDEGEFSPEVTETLTIQSPAVSSIRTLILVNRQKLESLYGTSKTDQLIFKLDMLANHESVKGLVVQVENDAAVAAAYTVWGADLVNTAKANAVTAAVKNLIDTQWAAHSNLQYLVIVGDDRVIPFRRVPDRTRFSERHYVFVSPSSTVGAALHDDMTLTDDYYADAVATILVGPDWDGHQLYIPDLGTGRLIETPDEIIAQIDAFLTADEIPANNAAVTGYSFVRDGAGAMCNVLNGNGLATDCTLINDRWGAADFINKVLNTRHDVVSINGHASHFTIGTPLSRPWNNERIFSTDVAGSNADHARALFYTLGCHAGLNVPPTNPYQPLDMPQALVQHKANYVANTGYAWAYLFSIGLSEQLMLDFTERLVYGQSATVGGALAAAKQEYYLNDRCFTYYDEKIMIESTLYGLPMYRYATPTTTATRFQVRDNRQDSAVVKQERLSLLGNGLTVNSLSYQFPAPLPAFTDAGTYFAFGDLVHSDDGEPIQPKYVADLSFPQTEAHGVVFKGGSYICLTSFNPVVDRAITETVTQAEPAFSAPGWYPSLLHRLNRLERGDRLVTLLGQFNPQNQTERIYDRLSFDVYYHTNSDDWTAPTITDMNSQLEERTATIAVTASDPSGIESVIVAYTNGSGTWASTELVGIADKWTGTFSAKVETEFLIQVVDKAGNVAVKSGQFVAIYLPLTMGNH